MNQTGKKSAEYLPGLSRSKSGTFWVPPVMDTTLKYAQTTQQPSSVNV